MKFTVNRSNWYRGNDCGSALLCPDGQMCCLGFLAWQVGADSDEIQDCGNPFEAPNVQWPDGIINNETHENSDVTDAIIVVNDDVDLSDNERENILTKKFKSIGIDVEFVE